MRSFQLLLLFLLTIFLSLHLASGLVLASPARSRKCRRALSLFSLEKRDEIHDNEGVSSSSLLPRLWRNAELPVPLGLNRHPPALPPQPPSSSWAGGTSKHLHPPPPTVSSILAGNPSVAKTRRERKQEVAEKKKQYENIRAGHAFVDMILDECGSWLKKDLPPRPKSKPKRGRESSSWSGSGSGAVVGLDLQPDRRTI
ncbi:hypothetical protein BCV69DRAFT_80155 [Microstroma glucosiphilum]|uniref:Uncharacterized protein n=1 Tax=Pseudomicrostroma glucosiphilum TaxID=1684307 RepID=A0A316U038_9BASI|nr:hypothetical protein BCV69DRAFT_80155 [Pseudomicrostroma glucosiphilum]PWN18264.1 hypothetical protein BCV69DRAFT_80155 [Pseudomicrostroma glucosiphilum]